MSISPLAWRQRLAHPRRRAGDDPRLVDENSMRPRGRLTRCKLLELPVMFEPTGSAVPASFSFVDSDRHIPFTIERAGFLFDVPAGARLDGLARRDTHELLVPLVGSFDVTIDDGDEKRVVTLNRAQRALYIPPLVWRSIDNFSSGALCMVLTSAAFEESDCYRSYDEFVGAARSGFRVIA